MGSCIVLRNSVLIASSLARIRFLIVLRPMTKKPHLRDRVQKCVKPRESKVSGFLSLHREIAGLLAAQDAIDIMAGRRKAPIGSGQQESKPPSLTKSDAISTAGTLFRAAANMIGTRCATTNASAVTTRPPPGSRPKAM